MRTLFVLLILCGSAAASAKAPRRFSYDLGPATVDVFSYPKDLQGDYAVFARSCSQCHTLARPINAPYVTRRQWERFVSAMHVRAHRRGGLSFSPGEAERILAFLVYDSRVRKVDRKASFDAQARALEKKFAAAGRP